MILTCVPHRSIILKKRTEPGIFVSFSISPMRYVELNPTKQHYDYSKYYEGIEGVLEPIEWNPEWGVMGRREVPSRTFRK